MNAQTEPPKISKPWEPKGGTATIKVGEEKPHPHGNDPELHNEGERPKKTPKVEQH